MSRLCMLAVFLVLPATAAAQQGAFVDAFIEFHSALAGTYGDEGPVAEAALDRMSVALAAWNAETRTAEAALRSGPADAPSALALFFLDAGRPADALDAIETAIRVEPEHARLHMLRGVLLNAAGRGAEALASFQRAWTIDPDDPVIAYLLADGMSTDQASERPERQLAALLAAFSPTGAAAPRRASFIQVALIDDTAADDPRFSRPWYAEGISALAAGHYDEAMTLFRAAMARDPLVADRVARSGRAARGVAALRQGRAADAVTDLEAASAAALSSSEARRLLGVAHATAGNVDASVKWLAEAIRLAPADERARVALARVLLGAGRVDEAERVLLDTLQLLPAAGRTRWALADLYEKTGRGVDALDQLEQAASLTVIAGKAALLWRLANVAHLLQDEERVVSALARRSRLMPNDAWAHRSLGLAYHQAGRDVYALVELLISSHLGLEDAEMLGVMGQIHLNAGRLTIAETVLRRAVAVTPSSARARYALARTLLRMGKTTEGQEQLAEFRRLQEALLEQQRKKYERDLQERNEQLRGEAK